MLQTQTSAGTANSGTNAVGQTYTGSTTPILTAVGGATTTTSGTGTIATVTTTSAHNLAVGDLVTVAGITPTGYNGTYVITAVATNTISYANATTGAQTVAGTVSAPAQASIQTRSSGTIGLVVKATPGTHIAPLQIWQNNTGATIATMTKDGAFNTPFICGTDLLSAMTTSSSRNVQFGSATTSVGGGAGVLGIANAATAPTSNPTGGGVLYASAGALNYIGTSGTAAAIVNADGTRTLDGGTA